VRRRGVGSGRDWGVRGCVCCSWPATGAPRPARPALTSPHPSWHPALHPPPPGGAGLLGSGPLLPGLQAAGLERYLSLVVLLACIARVVVIPRP
jgi:hypothetical protein